MATLLSAACSTMSSGAHGYKINSISGVGAGYNSVLIGTHCADNVTMIKVEVVSAKAVSVADAYVRAYLYDADKKLLKAHDRPPTSPCMFVGDTKPQSMPIMYEAGAPRAFHFPTQGLDDLPWKSIVVVFGDDDKAVAEVYPSGSPRDFDFPERALLR
ncbi:MAG: hypothetical protein M1392_03745 [Gammaproteobacteria bacterium]|nr:hypothetical protein [Gammaproteobacteria bacterium]